MSNTIRKGRKRPRVRSCSFRTLGWLIRREAAIRILLPVAADLPHTHARAWILGLDWREVTALAAKRLRFNPERRYHP